MLSISSSSYSYNIHKYIVSFDFTATKLNPEQKKLKKDLKSRIIKDSADFTRKTIVIENH